MRHPAPIHPDILSPIIAGAGALLTITAEIARGLDFPGAAAAVSVVAAGGLVCGLGRFSASRCAGYGATGAAERPWKNTFSCCIMFIRKVHCICMT